MVEELPIVADRAAGAGEPHETTREEKGSLMSQELVAWRVAAGNRGSLSGSKRQHASRRAGSMCWVMGPHLFNDLGRQRP
jgi:hypothetical protein